MRIVVAVCVLLALPAMASAADCARAPSAPQTPLQPTVLAPVSVELAAPSYRLGLHGGVLSHVYGEEQSVDQVLLRLRLEGCRNVALALPAPSVANPIDPNAYVKQTEFDNTPYRFNMTQDGKRMTADDFDAWIKATGYSAGRRVDPNAAAAEIELPAAATEE